MKCNYSQKLSPGAMPMQISICVIFSSLSEHGAKHSPPASRLWLTEGGFLASQRKFLKLTNFIWNPHWIQSWFIILQSSTFRYMLELSETSIGSKFWWNSLANFLGSLRKSEDFSSKKKRENKVSRIHPKSFPDTLEASRRPRNMFWDRFEMPEIF